MFKKSLTVFITLAFLGLGCSELENKSDGKAGGAAERKDPPRKVLPKGDVEFPGKLGSFRVQPLQCGQKSQINKLVNGKTEFDIAQFMESMIFSYYLPNLREAFEPMRDLLKKTENNCDALAKLTTTAEKEAYWKDLQDLWLQSMMAYHRVDLFKVGPMADNAEAVAMDIYSWPSSNSCGVDAQVLLMKKGQDLRSNDNLKGLDALEYLLYESELKHSCSSRNRMYAELEAWNVLSESERKIDRCKYVHQTAKQVSEDLFFVAEEWTKNNNARVKQYVSSLGEAAVVQELYETLFRFMDRQVKDRKLAGPAGIKKELCRRVACPKRAEHRWSLQGTQALKANYEGLMALLLGSANSQKAASQTGLLNILGRENATAVGKTFTNQVMDAQCHAQSMQGQKDIFELATLVRKARVCADSDPSCTQLKELYKHSKTLSDAVKADLRLALSAKRPAVGGGDSD